MKIEWYYYPIIFFVVVIIVSLAKVTLCSSQ